jgi:hypothetical protein
MGIAPIDAASFSRSWCRSTTMILLAPRRLAE